MQIRSDLPSGSTGSRLLSGHSHLASKLEETAAKFHGAESALLFNSGYDANLSVLSCVPARSDAIVYDEFVHASAHDGMRMGRARQNLVSFLHNDLKSLKASIRKAAQASEGSIFICIETVYSMDGDIAPLEGILELASRLSEELGQDVQVIADEAHAGGVFGKNGEGIAFERGLHGHPNLLARTVTFGKAFAMHGAVVLSSVLFRKYLINYARPFIYSTALPPQSVALLIAAYAFAKTEDAKRARKRMWHLVDCFQRETAEKLSADTLLASNGQSAIQGVLVPGNRECVELSEKLRELGFDVYPIRSPTVPRGSERIRIIIHSHNTELEINALVRALQKAHLSRCARL